MKPRERRRPAAAGRSGLMNAKPSTSGSTSSPGRVRSRGAMSGGHLGDSLAAVPLWVQR